MKTINEMIEVMRAYQNGKEIQILSPDGKVLHTFKLGKNREPKWNWRDVDYTIKPEIKVTPYTVDYEFLDAQRKHGPYLYKDGTHCLPVFIDKLLGVILCCNAGLKFFTYEELVKEFTWQDGTPCGIVNTK